MRPVHFWLALGVVVSAVWSAPGVALAAEPAQAEPEIYVALGDSVSAGFGVTPGHGFVERYFAYLQDPANGGVDVLRNLARGGETSTSMRDPGGQLEAATAVIGEPSDTKVVTLGIGGNDGVTGQCPVGYNSPPCPFNANYTAIVQALQAALAADPGDETFRVLEYFNPASGTGSANEGLFDIALLGSDAKVDCSASGVALGLNDLVRCIGAQYGAGSANPYPTFKAGGQSLMADSLHPNDTGHQYIACLFINPDRAGLANPCQPPPPPPPPPPVDKTAPQTTLSGRVRQRVLRQRGVVVFAVINENAAVSATAKITLPRVRGGASARTQVVRLGPVGKSISAGARTRLTLRASRKQLRRLRRALRSRPNLKATVTVRSTDTAGNSGLAHRTIKLVR